METKQQQQEQRISENDTLIEEMNKSNSAVMNELSAMKDRYSKLVASLERETQPELTQPQQPQTTSSEETFTQYLREKEDLNRALQGLVQEQEFTLGTQVKLANEEFFTDLTLAFKDFKSSFTLFNTLLESADKETPALREVRLQEVQVQVRGSNIQQALQQLETLLMAAQITLQNSLQLKYELVEKSKQLKELTFELDMLKRQQKFGSGVGDDYNRGRLMKAFGETEGQLLKHLAELHSATKTNVQLQDRLAAAAQELQSLRSANVRLGEQVQALENQLQVERVGMQQHLDSKNA